MILLVSNRYAGNVLNSVSLALPPSPGAGERAFFQNGCNDGILLANDLRFCLLPWRVEAVLHLENVGACLRLFTFRRLSNPVRRNNPLLHLLVLCEDCHITPFPPPSRQTRPRFIQVSCLSGNGFNRLIYSDFIDGLRPRSLVSLCNPKIRFAVYDAQCGTSRRVLLNG